VSLAEASIRAASRVNVRLYRWSHGRLGGRIGKAPILLLTTRGRRSGAPSTTPLLYLADGSELVVVASYGGHPRHPAWYLNLAAHPQVGVQIGGERFRAAARTATPEERARLWPRLVEMYGPYDSYQAKTSREIPVVVLKRGAQDAGG
jgi:deazaflavin-dependent oxidoreductase (nitroreductase family)